MRSKQMFEKALVVLAVSIGGLVLQYTLFTSDRLLDIGTLLYEHRIEPLIEAIVTNGSVPGSASTTTRAAQDTGSARRTTGPSP